MIPNSLIKEIALGCGVDAAGVVAARPLEFDGGIWEPKTILPQARSIISCARYYLSDETSAPSTPDCPVGAIAPYTRRNYYKELKIRLDKTVRELKNRFGPEHVFKCYSCAPSGVLPEKLMAVAAGVGRYGKHSVVLNENFGSRIVLGEILTSLEIEPDVPSAGDCGECSACVSACPAKALTPYVLHKEKCFQRLMNWRGIFPTEIREIWGARLYGCDDCQAACPKNKNLVPRPAEEGVGRVGPGLPLFEILGMDEPEFRRRFGGNQLGARWIDFDCIRRNAVVALGNAGGENAIPVLAESLKDPAEIVRAHAAWALVKIGGAAAREALLAQFPSETDASVRREIEAALGVLSAPEKTGFPAKPRAKK